MLARVPGWGDRARAVRALSRGMTNSTHEVEVDGRRFVVRVPGASTELLGIDRDREHHNARVAAALGIGPAVVAYLPDLGVMVTELLPGRTPDAAALRAPGMPTRIGRMLRRLHAGPPFRGTFDMPRLMARYVAVADRRGIPLPPEFRARLPLLERVGRRLAAVAGAPAPCHNDLVPENYLDDGVWLRAVDWEYSGQGDPGFDLGNTCQELEYGDPEIDELCRAYFGATTDPRRARVKLHMILSDAGWTLWAVIQSRISRIELDYWGYGLRRWSRALAKLDAPELRDWMDALAPAGSPGPGAGPP